MPRNERQAHLRLITSGYWILKLHHIVKWCNSVYSGGTLLQITYSNYLSVLLTTVASTLRKLECWYLRDKFWPPLYTNRSSNIMLYLFAKYIYLCCRLLLAFMRTLLLENQSQTTPTLWIPPLKQLALREIPSPTSTGLQTNIKITESCKITQTQPSDLPQGFGTYPITLTHCKHTCTPSTN